MTDSEKAKKIIEENIYVVIATSSSSGEPWISPVFFGYDDEHNLYWVSNKDSLHSKLVRENPQVALVVFNSQAVEGEGDGVYIRAKVDELKDEKDLQKGIDAFNARATVEEFRVKNVSEVTGSGVWRMYRATPTETTKLSRGTFVNGQYVDVRIPVDLS